MSSLPKVALVGRMNVGKSTLFNRLSTDVKSMTFDYPGVTRDFISDVVSWQGQSFELIDTGGISLKKSTDPLEEAVRQRALSILDTADVIVFVVDAKVGLTTEDRDILKSLYALKKPILVAANKVDTALGQEQMHEFYQLGVKELFPVSALHGKGIAELLEAILKEFQQIPQAHEEVESQCRVVLLGKPNVGKSSILNKLVQAERSIVSDVPGTTREAITAPINFYKQSIELVDTAGVRRKRGVTQDLEQLMVKSSLDAVNDADIVLLVVDAAEGKLADQELKLAFYAFERGKAVIVLLNKSDLISDESKQRFEIHQEEYKFFFKKIEMLNISCKTNLNIGKILPMVEKVWQRYTMEFDQDEINDLLKMALIKKPMYHKTELIELFRVEQVKTKPPSFILLVNRPEWIGETQRGFFENIMRKKYTLKGVPLIFMTRKKRRSR